MKEIVNVAKLKNVVVLDKRDNKHYLSKKGVIMIRYENDKLSILDMEHNVDITNDKNFELFIDNKKTKMKYIFKKDENFE